ncbi:MIP/aquaporin family protein [Mycobacterium sp.]|uniref:MIP/aquaporin family protein n=1 Tax=Mycobacterium sp. TaxID=1785 RepID=UPI002B91C53B|nr:aquaporin [Mycobacterium sp.]HKP41736.1 aquaporin [Mycobacterium sp.]
MTTTTPIYPSTKPVARARITKPVAHPTAMKYAVEMIGTLFLVFTIGASVRSGNPLAPLAIGAILMAMVYAGGHVSGAHYNPAVTLSVLVRRRIEVREAVGYWVAQLIGGLLGAALVSAVAPAQTSPMALSGHAVIAAFIAELLVTFALCYVVLNVATSKDHPANSFYGLAIGFTVAAGAVAVGGISGGAFNPAVAIAGVAMGMFSGSMISMFFAAQAIGAVAAGLAFRVLNPADN